MAVFTSVTLDDLQGWIAPFNIGTAHCIQGISSGIENSNFFVTTSRGEYVLTLFENLNPAQLPYYLHLMDHLARRGIPVPAPVPPGSNEPDTSGRPALFRMLNGKPAVLVSKLAGSSQLVPQPVHCQAVGAMLARMHCAGRDFALEQPNLRGLKWWNETVPAVLPFLGSHQSALLQDEMDWQNQCAARAAWQALPTGPAHCDLFRNNVMFEGTELTGFFDFYFAGNDTWLFDLAVTVNDWCIDVGTGALDALRLDAMLGGYQSIRLLTIEERQLWNTMLRAGALRFWLSRLYDFHLPRAAALLTPHDPGHFERVLRARRQLGDAPAGLTVSR